MKTGTASGSGVVSAVRPGDELSPDAVARACHEVLDATQVLMTAVDLMASAQLGSADGRAIAEDARASLARIASVAQALQAAARARSAA